MNPTVCLGAFIACIAVVLYVFSGYDASMTAEWITGDWRNIFLAGQVLVMTLALVLKKYVIGALLLISILVTISGVLI